MKNARHRHIQFVLASLYCSVARCLADPRWKNENSEMTQYSKFRNLPTRKKRFRQKVTDDTWRVDMYFGAGSYWYIQHELVFAERRILQRNDGMLTSRTGYAGGKAPKDKFAIIILITLLIMLSLDMRK
jgi:hypothetical protein